jgi:hypothetical protein
MSDGAPNIPPSDGTPNIPQPEIPPMTYPPLTKKILRYPPLTAADLSALGRAIPIARQKDEQTRRQIDRSLAEDGFWEAATTAAYVCQNKSLVLKPWEIPPVWIRNNIDELDALIKEPRTRPNDQDGYLRAALLVRHLHKLGLSRFEPNPLAAIEKAEKAKAKNGRPPKLIDSDIPIKDQDSPPTQTT